MVGSIKGSGNAALAVQQVTLADPLTRQASLRTLVNETPSVLGQIQDQISHLGEFKAIDSLTIVEAPSREGFVKLDLSVRLKGKEAVVVPARIELRGEDLADFAAQIARDTPDGYERD